MNKLLASCGFALSVVAAAEAPTEIVVLVSGREGVDKAGAQAVAEAVSAALAREGFGVAATPQAALTKLELSGVKDPANCEGRADCVGFMGQTFAPAILVGLHTSRVGKKVAVQLSAVLPGKSEVIAEQAFVLARTQLERPPVKDHASKLARGIKTYLSTHPEALQVEPPPPKPDEPKPPPPPEPVAVVPPPKVVVPAPSPPEKKTPLTRYIGIGVGVLAAGAAGFGAYEGLGALQDGEALAARTDATLAEWNTAGARAQRADIAYGAAGLLAVAAVILVILGPSKPAVTPAAGSATAATWTF